MYCERKVFDEQVEQLYQKCEVILHSQKIEVVFHLLQNRGRHPFANNLRSPSNLDLSYKCH